MMIVLVIRRFKCLAADCPAVTFAEQIPGLTGPYARYTPVLRGQLSASLKSWPAGPEPGSPDGSA